MAENPSCTTFNIPRRRLLFQDLCKLCGDNFFVWFVANQRSSALRNERDIQCTVARKSFEYSIDSFCEYIMCFTRNTLFHRDYDATIRIIIVKFEANLIPPFGFVSRLKWLLLVHSNFDILLNLNLFEHYYHRNN